MQARIAIKAATQASAAALTFTAKTPQSEAAQAANRAAAQAAEAHNSAIEKVRLEAGATQKEIAIYSNTFAKIGRQAAAAAQAVAQLAGTTAGATIGSVQTLEALQSAVKIESREVAKSATRAQLARDAAEGIPIAQNAVKVALAAIQSATAAQEATQTEQQLAFLFGQVLQDAQDIVVAQARIAITAAEEALKAHVEITEPEGAEVIVGTVASKAAVAKVIIEQLDTHFNTGRKEKKYQGLAFIAKRAAEKAEILAQIASQVLQQVAAKTVIQSTPKSKEAIREEAATEAEDEAKRIAHTEIAPPDDLLELVRTFKPRSIFRDKNIIKKLLKLDNTSNNEEVKKMFRRDFKTYIDGDKICIYF